MDSLLGHLGKFLQDADLDLEKQDEISADENEEQLSEKEEKSPKKATGSRKRKSTPSSSASDNKVENLMKFIETAGIHVESYEKLFETCKSTKAKEEKLMELLKKAGMKGRPTLEKCKKIERETEIKKEISELDISSILEANGRPKRKLRAKKSENTTGNKKSKRKSSVKNISQDAMSALSMLAMDLQGILDNVQDDEE